MRRMLRAPGFDDPQVIGRGGFGVVYRANETELGRRVAVKVLHDRFGEQAVERAFVRECRAMGALSGHPHIVTVHSTGRAPTGERYIVMAYLPGGSLADRLRASGALPWPEVVEIGVKLAGALETAHRRGVLHLDIKPANVLVSEYGEPALADFGIARIIGSDTSGDVRATAAYAAPEQLDGPRSVVGPAADLYGLGATLFTLLAGHPAFLGDRPEDPAALLLRIFTAPVPDLGALAPPPLRAVVERLMAKSPGDRYGSAAEVAQVLRALQAARGLPVTRVVIEGAPADAPNHRPAPPVRPSTPTAHTPNAHTPSARPPTAQPPTAQTPQAQTPTAPPPTVPPPPPAPPRDRPTLVGPAPAAVRTRRRGRRLGLVVAAAAVTVAVGVLGGLWIGGAPGGDTGAVDVVVRAGVDHPAADPVRARLEAVYTAVNQQRYRDAFAAYTADSGVARSGFDEYQRQQSTSRIYEPEITAMTGTADGVDTVVRFRSTQRAELAPDGRSTCTRWALTYRLVQQSGQWLIRGAVNLDGSPAPC